MVLNWSKYQLNIFEHITAGEQNLLIKAAAGSGKCLGEGTLILMFDGSLKKVEDIKINDLIMGPDSLPRTVLSINHGSN